MRRIVSVALALVLLGAGVAWWTLLRPRPDDREQIARLILKAQEAVRAKNATGVLKLVAQDYADGTYTRQDITQMVIGGFRGPEPFDVRVEAPTIQVQGEKATAQVKAHFRVGSMGQAGDATDLDVSLELRKERGRWLVVKATGWEPAAEKAD